CYTTWFFFFSSRRRHTSSKRDWSSDVCSSDLTDRDASLSGSRFFHHVPVRVANGKIANPIGTRPDRYVDGDAAADGLLVQRVHESGRASCRGRVEVWGVASVVQKKVAGRWVSE